MPISIYVTNRKSGKNAGKIPLYRMFIFNESGSVADFLVTRDAATSEAPANKPNKPYFGRIREDGEKGFRVELYEEGVGKKGNRHSLRGIGKKIRTNIQIHIGPGRSEGCFLLVDGIKGRNKFEKAVRDLMREDKRNKIKNSESFMIRVRKR